ncbi:MAG: U32 family peptidase [Desulfobacterales bacterium]|nr:U32 family peptidase [Desulfobacterales bacterium]
MNARARAQNFDIETALEIIRIAKAHGKKMYIALNILVHDQEINNCIEILEMAEDQKIDAIIIQDLGLLYIIRNYFPNLSVHASTQMFLHNSLQINALVEQGISRVILPRELRIDEITRIREKFENRKSKIEFEVFIHGALCFSFSGLCLASSYLYKKSGNRGLCKQVCRFAFDGGKYKYPFSMKDLESHTYFRDLLNSGVDSLKIEGRLRNTDYIEEVISYYRQALDMYSASKPIPKPPSWRYNRKTTSGYLKAIPYSQMICDDDIPWIGEHVGNVISIQNSRIQIRFDTSVFRGERLRVLTEQGVKIHEFTLLNVTQNMCSEDLKHTRWVPDNCKVYRVGTSQTPSLGIFKKSSLQPKQCSVQLQIDYSKSTLHITSLLLENKQFCLSYHLASENAYPQVPDFRIQDCFMKVDQYPFQIESLFIKQTDSLCVPIRELNQIRRDFFEKLNRFRLDYQIQKHEMRRSEIHHEFENIKEHYATDINFIQKYPVIPYEDWITNKHLYDNAESLWIELPLFVSESNLSTVLNALDSLIKDQRIRLVCHSFGWIDYLQTYLSKERIVSGGYVYCLNRFTYQFLNNHVSTILLSSDFDPLELNSLRYFQHIGIAEENGLRFFITRQDLPLHTYKFKSCQLSVIPRQGYCEVVNPRSCLDHRCSYSCNKRGCLKGNSVE